MAAIAAVTAVESTASAAGCRPGATWVRSKCCFKQHASLAIYLRVGGQPRDVVLSPFFLISAVLFWKLAKHIEQQEKDKNKKEKKESNIAKIRKAKSD
uniref:Small integral membrane protein 15 n=1 Tax=Strigamia maritima TaxID=126957 RepID=T1IK07_STRMM